MNDCFRMRPAPRTRVEVEIERLRRAGMAADDEGGEAAAMGIFSRAREVIAASLSDLLDRPPHDGRTLATMIREMEETLVEVRASAARTIADQKEMQRHLHRLDRLQADWTDKAQLALSKDREDLARAALVERSKAGELAERMRSEIGMLEQSLSAYEHDIGRLQERLRDARGRQTTLSARLASAENRVKLRTVLAAERIDEARARFERLERQLDHAEGEAEALGLGQGDRPGLADRIEALDRGGRIAAELDALKRSRPRRASDMES